jgi:hypothetical protein
MNYSTDPSVVPTFGNAINKVLGRFGFFTVELGQGDYTADKLVDWSEEGDPPTEAEVNAALAVLRSEYPMHELRAKRDALIAETDWWANSDLTMTAEQTAYRQALRDLPANTVDPENPVWPTKPE